MFFTLLFLTACSDYSITANDGTGYDISEAEATTVEGGSENTNQDDPESTVDSGTATGSTECVPTGDEFCDGIDDDCDGYVDEGDALDAQTWFYDADGDSHGGTDNVIACAPPAEYVASNDDCDDTNVKTYPGATEWCDFEDNDCDGLVEAEQPEYSWMIYHDDDDADGYGSKFGDGGFGCSVYGNIPEGHARSGDDCDDKNSSIYPGASC